MAEQNSQQKASGGSSGRIRNVQVRSDDRNRKRLMTEQIYSKTRERKAANDDVYSEQNPGYEGRGDRIRNTSINDTKQAIREVQELFRAQKEELSNAELDELTNLNAKPASLPDFPYIIVSLAILKDIFDFGDVIVIGIIFTTALSFVIGVVLFFWTMGKTSGGWWKKRLIKKLWTKYIFALAIEFIPFLKIIPTTTIFVLLARYDETKVVKLINTSLERLRGARL